MLPSVLTLALSLLLLSAGAELLVRGASAIALRAGVSSLFVGLTVVGMGTSTPELGASLFATLRGSEGIAIGNVVGSNLFNICVILGLTSLVLPLRVELRAIRRDILFAIAAAGLPFAALGAGGQLTRGMGVIFVLALGGYLGLAWRSSRRSVELASPQIEGPSGLASSFGINAALVLAGVACLLLGSRWFVDAAIQVASTMGLSERAIGLTVVSAGTSLPELVTSLAAAKRGNAELVVGNVIGSNIFNVLGVLGACSIARPQQVPIAMLSLDVPLLLVASIGLLPIVRSGGRISRAEGALLVAGYGTYLGWLLTR